MLSYWEQESFVRYNHIVVGAGIVGLSTAIELKEKYPDAKVIVLERGLLPTGASSRNAGFACMGSLTELLDDKQYNSDDEIVALYELRKRGLERLRNRLGDKNIGYAANGSYELISDAELPMLYQMDYLNDLLKPVTHKSAFRLVNENIKAFGFAPQYCKALIENACEGEIHTGKMLYALYMYAIGKGVEVKTGALVTKFDEAPGYIAVHIKDDLRRGELVLHSDTISICTNAFATQLLPQEDVVPGRGQVLITQPIAGLKFKGVYHFDKGYYYFREIDGRILLGGGRNLDFEGEATTDLALNERIQIDLEEKLSHIILPDTPFQIAQRWSGIMAFGNTKLPVVKAFSNRVFGGFRMGGMGVALGSETAKRLAELI